jgi:calpain-7
MIVFPYDHENGNPRISPSGKYVLRMYFNGCWRRVQIDDRLPTSSTTRVLHVIDRSNPGLLWPALLEKAYLKVRGGYDFPGSNSGTDLAVLSGWIPQQVFLHDEEVEQDELWRTIYNAFNDGDALLTLGTGKLPKREQRLLGLASEHDYAVLNLNQSGDTGEMLIKNPWSDGDVWHGAARRRPNPSQQSSPIMSSPDLVDKKTGTGDEMTPGTFWMDFRSVFQHFENIYINWNPSIFTHRQDLHFSCNVTEASQSRNLFVNSPQFAVSGKKGEEVWLLLSRHFRTGDYTMASQGRNGYISLYLYKNNGEKVLSSDGATLRGPFVDSPNTLLKFSLPSTATYTVVVATQDLREGKYNFTLSTFSHVEAALTDVRCPLDHVHSVAAAWTRSTAGGNSDSRRYLQNPQFKIEVKSATKVALILQISSADTLKEAEIHVKVLLTFSAGGRITKLKAGGNTGSGDYRRGSAVVETTLEKGNHTVICSTFDPDQYASFKLDLLSPAIQALRLIPLPAESSGRLSIMSNPATFSATTMRLLAPLGIPRLSRAIFILRPRSLSTAKSASLFKMTLEQGQGPYKRVLATSQVDEEAFSSLSADIRVEDTRLRPEMDQISSGGLWLVVERMAQMSSNSDDEEAVQVEILADERVELGDWGRGDG